MRHSLLAAIATALTSPLWASDAVIGTETTFESPNGLVDRCVRIAPMPGGTYSKGDLKDEAAFCEVNLYAPEVALCPKTWSTSPGMMIYDISAGNYAMDRAGFERNACGEGKSAKDLANGDLAKFKPTMNASGTSGTFAPSALLYYHFSRYFDTTVEVPVTVWRTMDAKKHLSEVARPGLAISGHNRSARMNNAGWQMLVAADQNPERYSPTDELFTSDRKQIFGVLTSSPGHRYGSEINGTRKSGWGKGQNFDFQETPAFLALRSEEPLKQAIAEGLAEGVRDPQIARDLGSETPPEQMVYWMKELTEIVLLDFIFSQQDRVGNIDFTPYYYWVSNGEVEHKKAKHHEPGDTTVPAEAKLIRRTNLNDNDAGGRVQYANFSKSTQMLEKLRHMDAGTYQSLMALDQDLQSKGPVHQWVSTSLGLDQGQIDQIVKNTNLAVGILKSTCDAGKLRFDLSPKEFLLTGTVIEQEIACGA